VDIVSPLAPLLVREDAESFNISDEISFIDKNRCFLDHFLASVAYLIVQV